MVWLEKKYRTIFIAFDLPMKIIWLNTRSNKTYNEICTDNTYHEVLKQGGAVLSLLLKFTSGISKQSRCD
jgi:hypothetical protein